MVGKKVEACHELQCLPHEYFTGVRSHTSARSELWYTVQVAGELTNDADPYHPVGPVSDSLPASPQIIVT